MEQHIDLSRFVAAHQQNYATALREIKNAKKQSHWMWYIFPQVLGLGKSSSAEYYAIRSLDEAIAFLNHPYLGHNLTEISSALLQLNTNKATEVFSDYTDIKKLKSSMTLFSLASGEPCVFDDVLLKFFKGEEDYRTLQILGL